MDRAGKAFRAGPSAGFVIVNDGNDEAERPPLAAAPRAHAGAVALRYIGSRIVTEAEPGELRAAYAVEITASMDVGPAHPASRPLPSST